MDDYLLEMRGIRKTFPGVVALDEVDFFIGRGEVHALMGENGAGKSTLMKVLTGVHPKDAGEIRFANENEKAQISTIYQELNLIPDLSVRENIFLGREPTTYGLIDWKTIERRSKEILSEMGLPEVDVNEPLRRQSVAVQQMVAIARAVSIDARLVVMDEPTSSLSEKEVRTLFRVINRLKKQNVSIIFISHKLDEVLEICDRATILRDGRLVGQYAVADLTQLKLVSLMIGRDATSVLDKRKRVSAGHENRQVVLKATNLSRARRTNEINIDIHSGEILGVAGLLGSGRTELARILFGDQMPETGRIEIRNKGAGMKSPRDAIRLGLGFCSEDRQEEGVFPNMSVAENMTMALLPELSHAGILSRKDQLRIAQTYIAKMRITTAGPNQLMKDLSGGNQQKVLLARWLCKNPILMILDEPTRGIDVGGKAEIENLITELADGGVAILMISSEMEELIRSCDRIAVLSEGRKVGELTAKEISEEHVMQLMAQGSAAREEVHGP